MQSGHPFDALTPELLLDALEAKGLQPDGRLLALNSYENRVYQAGIEDAEPVIVKFYRPGRWSTEQIEEELAFTLELAQLENPVVAPWQDAHGESLHHHEGFAFTISPRRGGRAPELDDLDNLEVFGRTLGRMHQVGASQPFRHRPALEAQTFGHDSIDYLRDSDHIPAELRESWHAIAEQVMELVDQQMALVPRSNFIRVHGDCHVGNVLWRDNTPWFVDFDDARMAPRMQDLWMLLSGDRERQQRQLAHLLKGYREFCDFFAIELQLIESLRTLRMLNHSCWIARRWDDPAFPPAFTWFGTPRYWEGQILELKEQLSALHEPPLELEPY
jgi:Ser/Thr protein kinase RdoA (MazF antagonist)